jgi:glyoxylase-like metal-dependent hydrolase (beta-lactamase superfamily II)
VGTDLWSGLLPKFVDVSKSFFARVGVQLAACSFCTFLLAHNADAQDDQTKDIAQVAGDLYVVHGDGHSTVFLVTSEGIILADPINTEVAVWLKKELATRFNVPVRYVIYSHHHYDHAAGAEVFNDTAVFIAHENTRRALDDGSATLPNNYVPRDKNGDGRIVFEEAGGTLQKFFQDVDRNGDGAVTGAELLANVRRPDLYYTDRMTIVLGGQAVELIHPGSNHTDDMTALLFPKERVLFAADCVNIRRLSYGGFLGFPPEQAIETIRMIESLDFDVVVPGHGSALGSKVDVLEYRRYFEDVVSAVARGIAAGKTKEELVQHLVLPAYVSWQRYDLQQPVNVAQAYDYLTSVRGVAR